MKKQLIIIGLSVAGLSQMDAQNPNLDYKYAAKVYNLTQYDMYSGLTTVTSSNRIRTTTETLQLFHPTVALQWKSKKNNFHEVELTALTAGKNSTTGKYEDSVNADGLVVSGSEVRTTKIAARYEYILNFNKTKDKKVVASTGFGLSPYFDHQQFIPRTSAEFPSAYTAGGARGFITPRLTFFIRSKMFIDLNLPLCVFDTYLQQNESESPLTAAAQRSVTSYNMDIFPRFVSGRIGVGLKI